MALRSSAEMADEAEKRRKKKKKEEEDGEAITGIMKRMKRNGC